MVNLLPQVSPVVSGTIEAELLDCAYGSVEGDPGHDFRMSKVAGTATHFPDPLVWLVPYRLKMLNQCPLKVPGSITRGKPHPTCLIKRVQHLTVDIQLQLIRSGVANAHRRGPFVSGQPGYFVLGEPSFPGKAIHDLHLGRRPGDSAQQPITPGGSFLQKAGVQQTV